MSQKAGKTLTEDRIRVSVDWEKVPVGESIKGAVEFSSNDQKECVLVSVFNPASPVRDEMQGVYMEENGYVSIPAAGFHRKFESNDIKMNILPGVGVEGCA